MTIVLGVLLLVVAIAWLARRPARARPGPGDRDEKVVARAEAEVRDLDPMATPEDATDELTDWGPGAPR